MKRIVMIVTIVTIALLATLVMVGCGADNTQGIESVELSKENIEACQSEQLDENKEAKEDEIERNEAQEANQVSEIFVTLPDEFLYSSGAGSWATELSLNDDGTFTGNYHDMDMGAVGENYPNGTMYISEFEGKFTEPTQMNEYIYSMELESFELLKEKGQEYIEEGIRYVVLGASELSDAEELIIYMPGTPYSEMDSNFMSWLQRGDLGPEDLRCYGIYNAKGNAAFIGYNYAELSELYKLDGTFISEKGDVLLLNMYMDEEVTDHQIGTCEWRPQDGEAMNGFVHRNVEGGFTINLPESLCYQFEIQDAENGKFVGLGYASEFGVFERAE